MIRAGVDWGSSTFRAYRFNESVDIVDSIATASGLKFIADRNLSTDNTSPFEAYLFDTIGQWLSPGDTVLLSGMVTSRTGWLETPYLPCPADLTSMMEHAVTRTINQINLIFLPGLSQRSPSPDVIRGEELQMLGASVCLTPDPGLTRDDQGANESSSDITLVMPGTHSKWAHLKAGCVQRFHTLVTGELFEVLTEHSLVGALATEGNAPASVFADSVEQGYYGDTIISALFSCRSGILLNVLQPHEIRDRLSGLLIGRELREGLALLSPNLESSNPDSSNPGHSAPAMRLGLIGSEKLCSRYLLACQQLSIDATLIDADAAALGFKEIIHRIQNTTPTGPIQ